MSGLVSVDEVAGFCMVTPRRIQQLVKEGLPQAGRGKYHLVEAVQWYIRYLQEKAAGRPEANSQIKTERGRLLSAQAEMAEFERDIKRGSYLPAEDVRVALNEAMVIIATNEDAIPGRLAQKLANMDTPGLIRQLLLNELRRGRETAADRLAAFADSRGRRRNTKATAGKNARRVGRPRKDTAAGKG